MLRSANHRFGGIWYLRCCFCSAGAAIPECDQCVVPAHEVNPLHFANPLSDAHPGSYPCLCKLRADIVHNCILGFPFVRVHNILPLVKV